MTKQPANEIAQPILWTVTAITMVIGCFWFFVFYLSQPTIYPNPGLAAYTPPAGTRLVPIPRKSDAPDLADIPESSPSPLTAMAQAPLREKEVKDLRKHAHAIPREAEQPMVGYPQQWSGDSNRGNSRVPSSPRMTGGPKSWF